MHCDRLLKKVASGDREAFTELYESTRSMVFLTVLSVVKDRHAAEDLMQETFLTVYRTAGNLSGRGGKTWIAAIARNKAVDYLRRKKFEFSVDEKLSEPLFGAASFEEQFHDQLVLRTALEQLEAADREVLLLSHSGLKQREIAKLTGQPAGTVAWRCRRALKKLSALLKEVEG